MSSAVTPLPTADLK